MPDSAPSPLPGPSAGPSPRPPTAPLPSRAQRPAVRDAQVQIERDGLLGALSESIDALSATRLSVAQRRIVEHQAESLRRLQALVEAEARPLRDGSGDAAPRPASTPDRGDAPVEPRPFDAGRLARDTVERVRERADRQGVAMSVAIPPGGGPHASGDPDTIRDILLELLDNAIRHTVRGAITVTVNDEGDGVSSRTVAFAVADTGVGLPVELHGRLFEPSPRAAPEAFGGLALAAARAARLGGGLAVDSEIGRGSVFVLRIPAPWPAHIGNGNAAPRRIAPDPTALAAIDRTVADVIAAARDGDRALRVLVAEARCTRQAVTLRLLTDAGHRVGIAADGVRAIDAVATGDFDVVLMDLGLPQLDGLEATRRIRAMRDPRAAVPIVGLIEDDDTGGRARCRVAGMDDAITRAQGGAELLARLQAVVARARRQHGHRPLCTGQDPGVDWQYLGDLRATLGAAGFAATLAGSASDVRRALGRLRSADDADLAHAARALKSAAGRLGLRDAFRLCDEAEAAADRGNHASARARLARLNVEARQGVEAVRRHYDAQCGATSRGGLVR